MPAHKYLRLGEFLIKEKLITSAQLEKALSVQKERGGRLGEILVKLGMIKEEEAVSALGRQLGVPYFSLGTGMLKPAVDQGLADLIPKEFALKNLILPLSRTLKSLTVAMVDPLDLMLIDNVRKLTNCEINPVIATQSDIVKAIEDFYGKSHLLKDAVEASYDISSVSASEVTIEDSTTTPDEELSLDKLVARAEEAPVVKLVDLIIRQAIDEKASDIHIEPFKDRICLRYRIDGKLYEIPPPAKHMHLPIVSRIKILSKLDIAEKRLPQDGAFAVRIGDRPIDLRVSSLPTIYGEKVVMRILDRSNIVLDLNLLGYDQKQLEDMRHAIAMPYGLVLLTGPTGCGKTTTLYAILSEIRDPTKNIVTVEDPVEYRLDGINQVHVKPEIGLTFAAASRNFLRQDPDVMLVGEIRDTETAQICIRAALTGHIVLSTLHTNDAPAAINRLIDIGVEPYLVTPTLILVVAQRLMRRLCPACKEAYEPTPDQLGGIQLKAELIYRPKGCPKCNNLGYRSRVCISEVMVVTDEMRQLITEHAPYTKLRECARRNGMQTLYDSAIKKVEAGLSSMEEALSITIGAD